MTNIFVKQVINEQETARALAKEKCIELHGEEVVNVIPPLYNKTVKSYMCPPFWDEILCWNATPAGTLAVQNCPSYFTGFIPTNNATRQCMENGNWYFHDNMPWTNYTGCYKDKITTIYIDLNKTDLLYTRFMEQYAPAVHVISQTGYIISLASLIIAFAIMLFIKKLHCARNILHMHLFASFILRALTSIVFKVIFLEGLGLPSDFNKQNGSMYFAVNSETNNWTCKFITSFWHYFVTANYSWILMEGLYLHNLIFRALFTDSSNSIKWYVVMGWGFPLIVIGFWIPARLLVEDSFCWTTDESHVILIIRIPTIISNLLNLCLFTRISVVLYSKLRSPINEDAQRYQKWFKSTLVLVPLFGVHYALFSILFHVKGTHWIVEVVWLFCDLLFGSFQGFFVAILYCFLNGEVRSEIQPHFYYLLTYLANRKYSKYFFPCRNRFSRSVVGRSSVCTTMSCSSLYTNGVLHRNSKCRLDSIPKLKQDGRDDALYRTYFGEKTVGNGDQRGDTQDGGAERLLSPI
ncbi:hypothetical protein Zmor_005415 [Zophobas morio]|uniref:Parathyroid hormone/parathyroid hormone-related peptide receptor n=1 Tax=Zophobas morio TaxID=2755281 RepID=A0AA38IPW8_9CUCU|nr:hypothetical protein Zmor_005415 [Zophobas morio]